MCVQMALAASVNPSERQTWLSAIGQSLPELLSEVEDKVQTAIGAGSQCHVTGVLTRTRLLTLLCCNLHAIVTGSPAPEWMNTLQVSSADRHAYTCVDGFVEPHCDCRLEILQRQSSMLTSCLPDVLLNVQVLLPDVVKLSQLAEHVQAGSVLLHGVSEELIMALRCVCGKILTVRHAHAAE